MKTFLYIIFGVLLFTSPVFSQSTGYIGLSIGGGIPVNHYGNNDINDSAAGFAKAGLNFEITFAEKISKKIGICALIRNQTNAMDAQAAEKQFAKKYPNIKWTMQADNWNIKLFMAGAYGSFPTGGDSGTSIDLKFMVGIASSTLPGYILTGTQSGLSVTAKQNSATSSAFCYALGIGLKKNITRDLCLLIGVDYMSTNPKFENVSINFSNGTQQTISGSQGITIFTANVGLGFRL